MARRQRIVGAVHPNAGLHAWYRGRLLALVDAMERSLARWLPATYRADPPAMAEDGAAKPMDAALKRLERQWKKQFGEYAERLAAEFTRRAEREASKALAKRLSQAGMTVRWPPDAGLGDALRATVAENVALIKSIPVRHMGSVTGAVMRSVQQGRDLATLTKELTAAAGVTKRRAATIARDQNNKATTAVVRARQQSLGITRARWVHSGAGRHPRPEHVAFSAGRLGGPEYDVAKGAHLEGRWTWPGVEINCRCVSRSVIPTGVAA